MCIFPVQLVDCPRDAMQGFHRFVPTEEKIDFLNRLLRVGFHTLDFGSFVSPKAIPNLRDTPEVLAGLDRGNSKTKLLAIVANERGAQEALGFSDVDVIGYPLSVSETFQQRNTRKSIADSWELVEQIQDLATRADREPVVYLSMAFGNPYEDAWSPEVVAKAAEKLVKIGIRTIALADTVGTADPETIEALFGELVPAFPDVCWGAHFHARPDNRREKVEAAWKAGCRRYEGALGGFGGCPFAADQLVGNVATEFLIQFLREKDALPTIDENELKIAQKLAASVYRD
jgi:hydroxymethylglutaryl-CoA lyase